MANSKETRAIKRDKKIIFLLPIITGIITFGAVRYFLSKNSTFIISVADGIDDFKTLLGIWGHVIGFYDCGSCNYYNFRK